MDLIQVSCSNCRTFIQVGKTDLGRVVCYTCFHELGGFGHEWVLYES